MIDANRSSIPTTAFLSLTSDQDGLVPMSENNLKIAIYDSDCVICASSSDCESKSHNICHFGQKCYLPKEPHPVEKCSLCSNDGKWEKKASKSTVTKIEHLKAFHYSKFEYDLLTNQHIFDFAQILSAPMGTRLERGRFVVLDTGGEKDVFNILLELTKKFEDDDGCGEVKNVLLELQIKIVDCPCLNGGKCNDDMLKDKGINCTCKTGFEGL